MALRPNTLMDLIHGYRSLLPSVMSHTLDLDQTYPLVNLFGHYGSTLSIDIHNGLYLHLQSYIYILMASHDLFCRGSYHTLEYILGHGPRRHVLMDCHMIADLSFPLAILQSGRSMLIYQLRL